MESSIRFSPADARKATIVRKADANRKLAAIFTVMAVLLVILALPSWALAATTNVATHTQDEIRSHVIASGATLSQAVTYAVEPDLTAPYENAGDLSDEAKRSALAMLNNMRYIAGLNDNVTLDSTYGARTQAATYVNAVNGSMSHYPTQPADMNATIYQLGALGARSSNIAWGYRNLNTAIPRGWMEDADSGNISVLGHRRWILNPSMGKTGFGATNNQYAMYAFDRSGSGGQTNVAWPAQQMPLDYWGNDYPWSLSAGTWVSTSNVRVTLTRERDGRVWNFASGQDADTGADKYFNVDNDGYGKPGCIIFRPDDVSYQPGDVFNVEITGATSSPITYTVEFFELYPVTDVQLDKDALSLDVGKRGSLSATVSPSNATSSTITWTSSDENIATVSRWGYVTAVSPGTATITATAGTHSAQATITVTRPVQSVSIGNIPEIALKIGETWTLTGTVSPEDASDPTITWTSSDESVATVDQNGTVTALGEGRVRISAQAGNAQRTVTLSITKWNIGTAVVKVDECTYNGKAQEPPVTVTLGGSTLAENADYTVEYTGNVDAGQAIATVTGTGKYTGWTSQSFAIARKSISDESIVVDMPASLTYTGKAIVPEIAVKDTARDVSLEEGVDYTVTVSSNRQVGTASVIIRGDGNYSGKMEKSFAITAVKNADNSGSGTETMASSITVNVSKVTVGTITAAANRAGTTNLRLQTITLGKKVKTIGAKAFADCPNVTKLVVKTKKLTKKSVKKALKNSKVATIQVKLGSKATNAKYIKKYQKIFAKSNSGRTVAVN